MTPESLLSGTLMFTIIGYAIGLIFSIYSLYLNYRQAKVRNTSEKMLNSIEHIEKIMEEHCGNNKK